MATGKRSDCVHRRSFVFVPGGSLRCFFLVFLEHDGGGEGGPPGGGPGGGPPGGGPGGHEVEVDGHDNIDPPSDDTGSPIGMPVSGIP